MGWTHRPWISFLAHDLVRDRGGKWYVLGQSTRAGGSWLCFGAAADYVASHGLSTTPLIGKETIRFFRTLRQFLRADSRDQDLSILMTPGQSVESYFEHAFLANHLDFTLAEGDV